MRANIVIMVILLMIAACNTSPIATAPSPFFPQQREANPDFMDALLAGELVLVDGCLRIIDSNGDSFLLIWPQGLSLQAESNATRVVDNTGRVLVQVGDSVEVSGGEMSAEHIEEYSLQPLPSGCSSPYWIVGKQINKR